MFYVGHGLGYSVGPLTAEPFLSQRLPNVSTPLKECAKLNISAAECEDRHLDWFYTKTQLQIPLSAYGAFVAISGIAFLAWQVVESKTESSITAQCDTEKHALKKGNNPPWLSKGLYVNAVIVFTLFSLAYNGVLGIHKILMVVEFVNSDAALPKQQAVLLSVAYFAAFAISRVLLLPLSKWVSALTVSSVSSVGLVAVGLVAYIFTASGLPIYWFFSIASAMWSGPIDPAFCAYICAEFPGEVLLLSAFQVGSSLGQLLFPYAVITIQKAQTIRSFFFANLLVVSLSLALLGLAYISARVYKRYGIAAHVSDDAEESEEDSETHELLHRSKEPNNYRQR